MNAVSEPAQRKGRKVEGRSPLYPHMDRRELQSYPFGDDDGFLDRAPHHILFPVIGFFLGLCSPVTAFLLRLWQADPVHMDMWIRSELSYNSLFYLYMGVTTVLAFLAFGYLLGSRSESQRVHNKSLRERMEELHLKSVTDGLTGAYSHAYLQEMLSIEMERSKRHETSLSILMMDLDDFKLLNDNHGHLFGDQVLKEITETVNMHIRQEDVLGRYGGEEFMVIMPGADLDVAKRVAERVRSSVARAGIIDQRDLQQSGPVQTTLSIGVATFLGAGKLTHAGLIDHADRNLYRAKNKGKNRICSDPYQPSTGHGGTKRI